MKRQTSCDNHNVLVTFDDSLLFVSLESLIIAHLKGPRWYTHRVLNTVPYLGEVLALPPSNLHLKGKDRLNQPNTPILQKLIYPSEDNGLHVMNPYISLFFLLMERTEAWGMSVGRRALFMLKLSFLCG